MLGCAGGHRFDVNKRGFVSLLPPRTRVRGDDAPMLRERAAFLDAGHYAPIADAVADLAHRAAPATPRIVDIGCGTGYYLRELSTAVAASAVLATDLSPDAVRMAMRTIPSSSGVVMDVWQPLPLRDGAADLILNVFAPRNPTEFARVLTAGGCYIGVVPTARHLIELRDAGLALDVPADKRGTVATALESTGQFEPPVSKRVELPLALSPSEIRQLIGMGPSSHHGAARTDDELPERVTVSVDVMAAQRV